MGFAYDFNLVVSETRLKGSNKASDLEEIRMQGWQKRKANEGGKLRKEGINRR